MTLGTAYGGAAPPTPMEIAKGNVPGHGNIHAHGRNPSVGTAFEDVWDLGGKLVYATAGEQWEIVSASANDTSAGTGARTVEVTYLDEDFVKQTETFTMNGTSAVSSVATNMLRFVFMKVLTWGSKNENEGTIRIRVVGAGNDRGGILFDDLVVGDEIGLNASLDSHYTVPAGKIGYIQVIESNVSKNHDVTISVLLRLFGESFFASQELTNYQNFLSSDFSVAPTPTPEKTDVLIRARSNNTDVPVAVDVIVVEVDN